MWNAIKQLFGKAAEPGASRGAADTARPAMTPAQSITYWAERTGLPWDVGVYVMEPGEGSSACNRIASRPLGLAAARWPTWVLDEAHAKEWAALDGAGSHGGQAAPPTARRALPAGTHPMEPVLCLDLDTVPELREHLHAEHKAARAVAVFVSSLDWNSAFEPGTQETKVLFLSSEEVAAGFEDLPSGGPLRVTPVLVPAEAFREREPGASDRPREVEELIGALGAAPGLAGGSPIWVQSAEHEDGEFLLQFSDGLVEMNLGDAGEMYVFEDTAFWQCC